MTTSKETYTLYMVLYIYIYIKQVATELQLVKDVYA